MRAWRRATSTGGKTYFLYDGEQPVCELGSTGSVCAVNTFGANGLMSRHTSSVDQTYTFDLFGNVSERTNSDPADPAIISVDFSNAYELRDDYAIVTDAFSYGGQYGYYSDTPSLILCTHRFYDSSTGRFLTRDPMGYAGGVNLYAYCGNNPVNESDPSGLFVWVIVGAVVGGGLDLGLQLLQNHGNLGNVNWGQVFISAAGGAIGGGIGTMISETIVSSAILRGGANLLAGAVIGAGGQVGLNAWNGDCLGSGVGTAAETGGLGGAFGSFLGDGISRGISGIGDTLYDFFYPIEGGKAFDEWMTRNLFSNPPSPPFNYGPAGAVIGNAVGIPVSTAIGEFGNMKPF